MVQVQVHQSIENTPATLTDEQRRRVADALESAQSENTRKNYDSQFGKFRTWCEQENYSPLPARYTRSEKALEALEWLV